MRGAVRRESGGAGVAVARRREGGREAGHRTRIEVAWRDGDQGLSSKPLLSYDMQCSDSLQAALIETKRWCLSRTAEGLLQPEPPL